MCPVVAYNRANTLHMLDRDAEAYQILRDLISVTASELESRCCDMSGRGLQLDCYFLLFHVALHYRGFCDETFAYAAEHLRRRRRGLHSVWSSKEVRAEIAAMRREWKSSSVKQDSQ
jgi:hypothetical protein